MHTPYKYRTWARWTSGQTGLTKSDSSPVDIRFCAPPEFGGIAGDWTPEDLLLAALGSCFAITFRGIAGRSKFEYADLQVEVEGTVSKGESGFAFSEIIFRPTLTIDDKAKRDRALSLLQKAKNACLVSKALAVAPGLEPRLEVSAAVSLAGTK
jgi:peroxiredoxin-like protein